MDNELIVSDKSKSLLKYCKDIDLYSVKSFSLSGYTIGDKTLYANIKQLKPGYFMVFNNSKIWFLFIIFNKKAVVFTTAFFPFCIYFNLT